MLRLLLLILPLGLDTFAVAAALGVAGLDLRERVRVSAVFAAFEGGMPIVGLLLGAAAGRAFGGLADLFAIVALAAVGLSMLREGGDKPEAMTSRLRGRAILGLGLSISLDELAIGVSLGLLRVPLGLGVGLIAIQALVLSQLGLLLGRRVGERLREGAEQAAGVALIAIATALAVAKLIHFGF